MTVGTHTANIVHFASNRCKRVTRSVIAAEAHSPFLAFDYAYVIADIARQTLGRTLDIEVVTDVRTVFNGVAKDWPTTERRLQIDIWALREAYTNGEVGKICWIPGMNNLEDGSTKNVVGKDTLLCHLVTSTHFVPKNLNVWLYMLAKTKIA